MNKDDYVRTPNGVIARIIDIQDEEGQYFLNGNAVSLSSKVYISDKNITIGENFKHSPNIIDLIEVGDYVNGSKVVDINIIGKDKEKWVWVEQMEDTDNKYGDDYVGYNNEQIESIVTKEQFSAMEYKVESEVK